MNLNHKHIYRVYFDETIPDPPPEDCYIYTVTVLVPENIGFSYVGCDGSPVYIVLNSEGTATISPCCSSAPSTDNPATNKYTVLIGDPCGI